MDIPRPELKQKRRIRSLAIGAALMLLATGVAVAVARLERSAPTVPRASVWVDSVREGELMREVRGPGVLVPKDIRWITAQSTGRIERVIVRPGTSVAADTVLIEMSNPDLLQQAEEARFELEAAQAQFTEMKLQLTSQHLDRRAAVAVAHASNRGAQLQAEAEKTLAEEGIVPAVQYQRSELLAEQLSIQFKIEQERLQQFSASMDARLAAERARVELARNAYARRTEEVEALHVRAGMAGVLQHVLVEEGQQVAMGANLVRIARPDELRAELRVAETQARDVQLGQDVRVDTRNGIVEGRVMRIDPAVQAGTVLVDVELTGALPKGARPDQSVEGTIEIEHLLHVTYTGRPAYGQPNTTVGLFKLVANGREAVRVSVQLGRASANAVEIVQGLAPGDQVILSDTSAWNDYERIRLD
jgi:HlyD family secretion protein